MQREIAKIGRRVLGTDSGPRRDDANRPPPEDAAPLLSPTVEYRGSPSDTGTECASRAREPRETRMSKWSASLGRRYISYCRVNDTSFSIRAQHSVESSVLTL
jgi:hypothetical protein